MYFMYVPDDKIEDQDFKAWLQLCPKMTDGTAAIQCNPTKSAPVMPAANGNNPSLKAFARLQEKVKAVNGEWRPDPRRGDCGYRPQLYLFYSKDFPPVQKFLKVIPVGHTNDLFVGLTRATETVTGKGVLHLPLSHSIRNEQLATEFAVRNLSDIITCFYSFLG